MENFLLNKNISVVYQKGNVNDIVCLQLWFAKGSSAEETGQHGLAHFTEHIIGNLILRFVTADGLSLRDSGADFRGVTTYDYCMFSLTLRSRYAIDGLLAFEAICKQLQFGQDIFEEEKKAILTEISMNSNSIDRKSSELIYQSLFWNHNYSRNITAGAEDIHSVDAGTLRRFIKETYLAAPKLIVVSGDLDFSHCKEKAQLELTLDIGQGSHAHLVPSFEIPLESINKIVVQPNADLNRINFSYRIPNLSGRQRIAFKLVASIFNLAFSRNRDRRLGINFSTAFVFYKEYGVFNIHCVFTPIDAENGLDVIKAAMALAVDSLAEVSHLEKVKMALVDAEFEKGQDLFEVAQNVGLGFVFGQQFDFSYFMQTMLHLEAAELEAFIRSHLILQSGKVSAIVKNEIPGLDHLQVIDFKEVKLLTLRSESKGSLTEVSKISLQNEFFVAAEIKTVEYPSNSSLTHCFASNSSFINFQLYLVAGFGTDPAQKQGLSELYSRVLQTKINQHLKRLGGSTYPVKASISNNRPALVLNLRCIHSDEDLVIQLIQSLFDELALESTQLDAVKKSVSISQKRFSSDISQQVRNEVISRLFGGGFLSNSKLGTAVSVSGIELNDLLVRHKLIVHQAKRHGVLFGRFELAKWTALLSQIEKHFLTPLLIPVPSEFSKIKIDAGPDSEEGLSLNGAGFLACGFRSFDYLNESQYAVQVLHALLDGPGGLLSKELRERVPLVYTAIPFRTESFCSGYFGLLAKTLRKNKLPLLVEIEKLFQRLASTTITEAELHRAKQFLYVKRLSEHQKPFEILETIGINKVFGRDFAPDLFPLEKVNAVSPEDVRNTVKKFEHFQFYFMS